VALAAPPVFAGELVESAQAPAPAADLPLARFVVDAQTARP
jgi:hypothetical protein